MSATTRLDAARLAATGLVPSLAAAAGIHLGLAAQHDLTSPHGPLFLGAGLAQAALAAAIGVRLTASLLLAAVALSAAVIASWSAIRLPDLVTDGVTLGAVEAVTTALEVVTLVSALVLLRRASRAPAVHLARPLALYAAVLVGAGATVLGATYGHHHDHHAHAHADDAPQPIFGDLFADHHAEPHECGAEQQAAGASSSHCPPG